jgi:hypothetical protein
MQRLSKRIKTGASAVAVLVVLLGVYGFRKLQALAADPVGEKDCTPATAGGGQGRVDLERVKAIAPLAGVKWSQLGGSINDASCLNRTEIYGVVEVHDIDDVAKALAFARDNKLSITTAGVRHSMGVLAGALHQPDHRRRRQPAHEEGDRGIDRPHHRAQGPVLPAVPAVLFTRPAAALLSADQRVLRGEAQIRSG